MLTAAICINTHFVVVVRCRCVLFKQKLYGLIRIDSVRNSRMNTHTAHTQSALHAPERDLKKIKTLKRENKNESCSMKHGWREREMHSWVNWRYGTSARNSSYHQHHHHYCRPPARPSSNPFNTSHANARARAREYVCVLYTNHHSPYIKMHVAFAGILNWTRTTSSISSGPGRCCAPLSHLESTAAC